MSDLNIQMEGGTSIRLLTQGKYCDKNIVVEANGAVLPELTNPASAEQIVEGYDAINGNGVVVSGTNPYEKAATDAEVDTQADLIHQIKTVLNGKAAGGTGKPEQEKTASITENGQYEIVPDEGYTLSKISVDVNVGGDADAMVTRTLTEYENNRVDTVGSYAFANCKALEKVILSMAQTLATYAFYNDTALELVDILGGGTLSGTISTSCLLNCDNLTAIIMRNKSAVTQLQATTFPFFVGQANITRNNTRAFWNSYSSAGKQTNWSGLSSKPTGSITYIKGTVTDESSKPIWLFGRHIGGNSLETLASAETEEEANALMLQYEEYFINDGCKFYVPAALVDSYKAATNWATYAEQIRAIEDYPDITGG